MPGMEADRSMAPVPALIVSPEVEENVPPMVPVTVGVGLVPLWQNDEPLKLNVAVVPGFTVTVVAGEVAVQPPALVTTTVKEPPLVAVNVLEAEAGPWLVLPLKNWKVLPVPAGAVSVTLPP